MYKLVLKISMLFVMYANLYAGVWNSPYSSDSVADDTLFSAFSIVPKHLDPVVSYNANEWRFIGQVYEPFLQYNYLKRPYELEPLTLSEMPTIKYIDSNNNYVSEDSGDVKFSQYHFKLRRDVKYQNHPSFVKDENGKMLYGNMSNEELEKISSLNDFKKTATRNLYASDYAYAIKRMAVKQNHSPILDNMSEYIVGLKEYSTKISNIAKEKKKNREVLDLRKYEIEGVEVLNNYELLITIKGKYPQFLYWISMYFFAPIPWEADLFYQQQGLIEKNLTLDWQPVGTGAYFIAENNPSKEIILKANPNFHHEVYPDLSEEGRKITNISKDLIVDAGKELPLVKRVVYKLEKESIPLWNKFLQGYYDASGVSAEAFDQAVHVSANGNMGLSKEMAEKGIELKSYVQPTIYYMAFNMEDPIVGGYSEESKKLRQAISIAVNEEEFISIFMNERGVAAQGPIPPEIFGYEDGEKGTNRVVYDWKGGKRVRKDISEAKKLLAEAGYPNGISSKTGKQLKLHYDAIATGSDSRTMMDWRRKQFAKLGIQLVIRSSDYNRFQEKVRKAKVQIYSWGWNADYPDPENFLFLLYGGNAIVNTDGAGINSSNYQNSEFDKLFNEIKTMKNTNERKKKIEKMLEIVREDAPWVWGFHSKSIALTHKWFKNVLPNAMANNTLKYKRIDNELRVKRQKEWNRPEILPLFIFILLILITSFFLYRTYKNRQKAVIVKIDKKEEK